MKKIKTGADKLVELIEETKRISLDDAAKALGTSKDVVQEWADFLEKQKLISIDYSFSKVFFTQRRMSSGEVKSSAKEIVYEKDGFIRKVEFALSSLEKESVNFDEIKKKFNSIHGEVKDEIKTVERELAELEKYNKLKSNIDREIEAQKKSYSKELDDLKKDIKVREGEFSDLYSKILKEKEGVREHKDRILALQKSKDAIVDSISSANAVLIKLKEDLKHEDSAMQDKLKNLDKLTSNFDDLSNKVIKEKKRKIEGVTQSFDREASKLLSKQDELLLSAKKKAAKLESYEDLGKKIKGSFEGFFNKTVRLSKKIDELDRDKIALKSTLLEIYKKAKALNIMSGSANLKKQAQEIEAQIKKYDESKKKFLGKIKSLLDDLRV